MESQPLTGGQTQDEFRMEKNGETYSSTWYACIFV